MKRNLQIRASKIFVCAMIAMQVVFAGGSSLAVASNAKSASASAASAASTSTVDTTAGASQHGNGNANGHDGQVDAAPPASTSVTTATTDTSATTTGATVTQDTRTPASTTATVGGVSVSSSSDTASGSASTVTEGATATAIGATTTVADAATSSKNTNASDTVGTVDGSITTATTTDAGTTPVATDTTATDNAAPADTTAGTTTTTDTSAASTTDATTVSAASGVTNAAPSGGNKVSAPTLTTDQQKYSLGANVTLTGTGFLANAAVTISIVRPDNVTDIVSATADASGAFTATYFANPAPPGRYNATATDGTNSASAAFTEADNIGVTIQGFNVKTQGGPSTYGWTTGDLGKDWAEGTWVPYQVTITGVTTASTGTSTNLPDVYLSYDYTISGDRFIDLVRDVQVGTTTLDNFHGWVASSGSPYPLATSTATQAQIVAAENSTNETAWTGFKLVGCAQGKASPCMPTSSVNTDTTPSQPGTTTDGVHEFEITSSTIASILGPNFSGTVTIYFQLHESQSFVWSHGLEHFYNSTPTDVWGGALYGNPIYATDTRNGSGFVPGSSGHAHVNMTGIGQKDVPIPIPPQPSGSISGYKWQDDNGNGVKDGSEPFLAGWPIHLSGTFSNIVFGADATTTASGTYAFTGLTSGNWLLTEDAQCSTCTPASGWSQTFPTSTSTLPAANGTSTSGGSLAPYGWAVTLTDATTTQANLNFGNRIPQSHLTLVKVVVNANGGTATSTAWTLTATSASTTISGVTGSSAVTNALISPGTYSLSESSGPSGYVSSGWSCSGGTQNSSTSVTLASGDSATCTITNTAEPAHLTLVKVVVNDDGGTATTTDWTLVASSTSMLISGKTGDSSITGAAVAAGTYALSESGPGGYASSSWACTGTGTENTSTSITLGLDASSTCTITNNDIGPTLKLVKIVDNGNGGTATSSDWTLSATAASPNDGRNFSYAGGTDTFESVYANAGYVLAETSTVTGYTEGTWSCDSGSLSGDTVTLGLNQNVTCTITNTAQPATLIVKKIVINDNGGTATAGDFLFQVNGGASTTFLQNASDSLLAENDLTVDAGTYNVTEPAAPGYATTYDNCSDIVIPNGGSATCTITNNDIGPQLTLVKVVHNDYGGTATTTDWTLTATGSTTISGAGGASSGAGFSAGTYTLSESAGPSGYASSSWTCVGTGSEEGASITLGLNQSSTCTIVNSDIQPQLTVIKHVVNAHGGTASSTDFTMNVDGTNVSSSSFPGMESPGVTVTLDAGSYSVTESGGPGGYTEATSTDCTGTIAVGEMKTCTITNSDNPGTLIVHKVTFPANDPTVFSITLSFAPESGGATRDLSTATDTVYTVSAGTYSVTEASTTGWLETSSTCSGVTVPLGGSASCTITNTKLATLTLVKDTVGGDDTFNFAMTGDGLPATTSLATASGTASQDFANLDPANTYSISETNIPAGWANTSSTCDNGNAVSAITLTPGGHVTCTFTNNKPQAEITLTPLTAYNAVGMNHTVTSTVQVNDGDGSFGPAPDGTLVTFSLLNNTANASFVGGNTCTTSGGECSITINATSTGSVNIHATAGPQVLGVTVSVATDGTGGNSVDAVKTYENARITIGPTATNEVGNPHTFTVTVQDDTGSGFTGVSGLNPTVTFGTSTPTVATNTCASPGTNASGTCTVVINSGIAGIFTASASATLTVNGVDFNISTDGTGSNSGPATKTYVDGSIALSPLEATNAIGHPHTITAHATQNDGTGVTDVNGATVDFGITSGLATFDGPSSCTTNASGTCAIEINSSSTGSNTINASTTFTVGGVSITRATDSNYGPDGTGPAVKNYVNATISIVPSATNEVGDPHTFTVTVLEDTGSGLTGVSGVNPVVTIDPTPASTTDTCASVGTNASGTCSVTIDSFAAGTFTASATLQLTVGGVTFNLITDGTGGNSGPATKTYVDAQILVSSSSVNEVGDPHTFTVTVNKNLGDGGGFVPASGETVASSISGTGSIVGGTCVSGTTDGSGECTIVVSSTVAGVATVHASTTVDVGGVSITRSTGDSLSGDSPDTTKTWVDANISLTPASATDPIGDNHLLTAHVNVNDGSGFANAPDGTVIGFTIVSGPGSLSSSTCTTAGGTGSCTTTLTSLTPGTTTVNAAVTLTVGGLSLSRTTGDLKTGDSDNAVKTWEAGGLTVTKVVSGLANVVGSSTISKDFNVTVTGPSYPSGTVLTFSLVDGVLQAPTSQTLSPLIPGNYTVTEADAGTVWNEAVPTSSITVAGNGTSTATVTNTYQPGTLLVTKAIALGSYAFASTTNATFTITVAGPSYPAPTGTVLTFNVTNGVVSGPQTLDNLIPGTYSVTESDPGIAWTVTNESSTVTVNPASSNGDTVTNTLKQPHTTISITPNVYETQPGENVILTISDTNDGQVPLTDPSVVLTFGSSTVTFTSSTPGFTGDTNNNGVMDVGETWTWTYELVITSDTTFTVDGHGYDPLGNDISPENGYTTENGTITVKVVNTTRTLGFWQTHTGFTDYVFNLPAMQQYVGVDLPVASTTSKGIIDDTQSLGASELLGGFYAPIAKTTAGVKRNPVDQARIVLLQQLLAAKLNCAAFGCTASTTALIAQADAGYHNGNKAGMSSDTSLLDAFNNSGDTFAIPAGLPATGKATPSLSKSYANLAFWNTP